MKKPKGSAAVWVIIALVIVIVAGAEYWYWSQNSSQSSTFAAVQVSSLQTVAQNTPSPTQTGTEVTQQTSIAPVSNQAATSNNDSSQSISVTGMSEYTDANFGFSFWYPSNWSVTTRAATSDDVYGGFDPSNPVEVVQLSHGTLVLDLVEGTSPQSQGLQAGGCGTCMESIYFDSQTNEWMDHNQNQEGSGSNRQNITSPADVSLKTMGGLPIFGNTVALSPTSFVVVANDNNSSADLDPSFLAKTIVSTDPSAGTPASGTQQDSTIEAEQTAYAGQ